MIRSQDITVVLQGDVRPNTGRLLQGLRLQLPQAQFVLSTFADQAAAVRAQGIVVDRLCLSEDPGPMPPTVSSPTAPPNNINRMLRSTQRGLSCVTTPFVLKLRSDAECSAVAIVQGWERALAGEHPLETARLGFASHFTRHPQGINGYTFHVSDWLTFGRAEVVSAYWSAPPFTAEEAVWFDVQTPPGGLTATARRFRAVFSQEQWVCVHYARRQGYATPSTIHDRRPEVVRDYERFLARECAILGVKEIELLVPKQAWARESRFQDLDCVSLHDWQVIAGHAVPDRARDRLRALARRHRHLIARGVLSRKWLVARWASLTRRPATAAGPPTGALPG
jgi:hypothetical protein